MHFVVREIQRKYAFKEVQGILYLRRWSDACWEWYKHTASSMMQRRSESRAVSPTCTISPSETWHVYIIHTFKWNTTKVITYYYLASYFSCLNERHSKGVANNKQILLNHNQTKTNRGIKIRWKDLNNRWRQRDSNLRIFCKFAARVLLVKADTLSEIRSWKRR